ncbi:MAG: glycoside hydrolase family 95-like protein [Hymenobacter sp.]
MIETPLSAAQSIHDMLLQSWGGKIRVFPAVPTAWAGVSYQHLSAEGGFLVSAARQGGRTRFVTITSRAGGPCVVRPGIAGAVLAPNSAKVQLMPLPAGWYRLALKKGQSATLRAPGTTDFTVRPVAHRAGGPITTVRRPCGSGKGRWHPRSWSFSSQLSIIPGQYLGY